MGSADGGDEEFDGAVVSFDDDVDLGGAASGDGVLVDDLPELLSGSAAGEGLSGDVGDAVALFESHRIVRELETFDHAVFLVGDESGAGESLDVDGADGQARAGIGSEGAGCFDEPGGRCRLVRDGAGRQGGSGLDLGEPVAAGGFEDDVVVADAAEDEDADAVSDAAEPVATAFFDDGDGIERVAGPDDADESNVGGNRRGGGLGW